MNEEDQALDSFYYIKIIKMSVPQKYNVSWCKRQFPERGKVKFIKPCIELVNLFKNSKVA